MKRNSEIIENLEELDEDDQGPIPRSYKNNTDYLYGDATTRANLLYEQDLLEGEERFGTEAKLGGLTKHQPNLVSPTSRSRGTGTSINDDALVDQANQQLTQALKEEADFILIDSKKKLEQNKTKGGSWCCRTKKSQQKPIVKEEFQEEDELEQKTQNRSCWAKMFCRGEKREVKKEL
jgi:hypothetical protein